MTTGSFPGDVRDPELSQAGKLRIEWAAREMHVLGILRDRFSREKPLTGIRLSACLHITSETANLALVLKEAGANIVLCASNPLSTQDDVAAALTYEFGIPTFAIKGEDTDTYYRHIGMAIKHKPQITLDDGADLVTALHTNWTEFLDEVIGGTEETTTGVIRLRSMAEHGKLQYPVVAVNDADTKHLFDNRYGTGQSTLDGITRATNILWAGKKVVVLGYGWCGRGVAMRARGMGAHAVVTEVDPVRALEAVMDGFEVLPMMEASLIGDVFITVTGNRDAVDEPHFKLMKNGAIIANSGHFNVEINIPALENMAVQKRFVRPFVEEYLLEDNRKIYLLGDGRLINLAAAEGHPSSVMDMSFAGQAMSVIYLIKEGHSMGPSVHPMPEELDKEIGRLKLSSMGIIIDELTEAQRTYLSSWEGGT